MNPHFSSVIFIIDDEEIIVDMLTAYLQVEGYTRIHGFTDSVEAIASLSRIRPDVILTDIHMPEAGGNMLTRLVKAQDNLQSVPVIAVTADGSPETAQTVIENGAAAVLLKPVKASELVGCVMECLVRSRRCDEAQHEVSNNLSQAKAKTSALLLGQETKLRGLFGRSSASGSDC